MDNIKPVILAESTVPCYVVRLTRIFTAEAKPNLDPSSISRHHELKRFRAMPPEEATTSVIKVAPDHRACVELAAWMKPDKGVDLPKNDVSESCS